MLNLIVIEGETKGLVFGLRQDPVTVGRSGAADIVLSHDKKVSHFHSKLLPVGPERYVIQDLGSTNGTYVNGEPIEQSPLRVGDRIQIGRTHFLLTDRESLPELSDADIDSVGITGERSGPSVAGGNAIFTAGGGGSSHDRVGVGVAEVEPAQGAPTEREAPAATPKEPDAAPTGAAAAPSAAPAVAGPGGGHALFEGIPADPTPPPTMPAPAASRPALGVEGEGPMGTERWDADEIQRIRASIAELDEAAPAPDAPDAPRLAPARVPPELAAVTGADRREASDYKEWTDQEGTEEAPSDAPPRQRVLDLPRPDDSGYDLFPVPVDDESREVPPDAVEDRRKTRRLEHVLRVSKLRLESLYRLGTVIATRQDETAMLGDVLDIALRAMHAERGAILLVEERRGGASPPPPRVAVWRAPRAADEQSLESAERKPFPVSQAILEHAIDDGRAVLIPDALADPRLRGNDSVRLGGVRSALCVPLRGRRTLGAIYVDNRAEGTHFVEEDLRFLVAIANQASVGLEEGRAYRDLVRRNEELRQLDSMKAEFMALVAHELRTPLTNIQGPLELLETDAKGDEERELLASIRSGCRRMQRLVRDVTEFMEIASGDRSLRREEFDLVQTAQEVVRYFAPMAEAKSVALAVQASDGLGVHGDKRLLAQVLSRLVENAIKFTTEGSIDVVLSTEGGGPRVSIQDTGQGIRSDRLQLVFESLQTAHDMRHHGGGIGIGLAVVKAIIERHGGQIWVESEGEGLGSTFTFRLPERGAAPRE